MYKFQIFKGHVIKAFQKNAGLIKCKVVINQGRRGLCYFLHSMFVIYHSFNIV